MEISRVCISSTYYIHIDIINFMYSVVQEKI